MGLKIREKSILLFCVCALLPLVLLSAATITSVHDATARFVTGDLNRATHTALLDIDHFFTDRIVDIRSWSDLRVMQDVLIDDQQNEIGRDLDKLSRQYPYYADLA